jgi:hypothetical protein
MAIEYPEKKLAAMERPGSRLSPVIPGDVCVNCQQDCDGDGFLVNALGTLFYAARVNGRPYCARASCYFAKLREFAG